MTRRLPSASPAIAWILLVMAVVVSGCGQDGPKLVHLNGLVTLDGLPLAHAHLAFRDADGTGRRGAAARTDEDGYYYLRYSELRDGIEPGMYKVSISTLSPEMPGGLMGIKEQVPPKYNKNTTLTVEASLSGASELNFDLVTK